MAQSRKRTKPQRKRQGAQGSGDPQVRHAPSPKTALRPLLAVLRDVVAVAESSLRSTPNSSQQLVRFDIQILTRGANSLKAVRILLEQGHWEYAVGVTRQLFELLVNMEHLGERENRDEATLQFARFGLLQFLLAEQRRLSYDKEKGRPFNPLHLAEVEHHLQGNFTDFRANTKDGSVKWVSSWCRKTTADLANGSSDPMRPHQYQLLYKVWSEQAHAAPGALIKEIFRDDAEDWAEQAVAENDSWSKDTICFAIMFFLRLWMELPNVKNSPDRIRGWLAELNRHYYAPEISPSATAAGGN
ncbi:DUF5677 domain-containing protein [Streptomyces sp. 1114.5]|uniref:DUF5677 domain-containing protein n=1 Tax=Streptomyces sp. 1114.5 TaxID=1938830 RepID=UPI0011C47B1F|nr:DUF5677 domain-containing protein [Streptomyces sp. 1114.5]